MTFWYVERCKMSTFEHLLLLKDEGEALLIISYIEDVHLKTLKTLITEIIVKIKKKSNNVNFHKLKCYYCVSLKQTLKKKNTSWKN